MSRLKRIYFASAVEKNGGYRGKLLGNTRVMSCGYVTYDLINGSLNYGGPFALSDNHGCWHYSGLHGLVQDGNNGSWCGGIMSIQPNAFDVELHEGVDAKGAVSRCLDQIRVCDAVHAYIDRGDCYGTIAELGYAAALQKPIYLVFHPSLEPTSIPACYTVVSGHDAFGGMETLEEAKLMLRSWDVEPDGEHTYIAEESEKFQKDELWFIKNLPSVIAWSYDSPTAIHTDLLTPTKESRDKLIQHLKQQSSKK